LPNKLKVCKETSFSKVTMVMRFLAKKKCWLLKSTVRFPAKKRWHSPPLVGLSSDFPPPPPESVRTGVRTDGQTLMSQPKVDRLPNLLSNGTPLVGFACGLHYDDWQCLQGLATE